MGPSRARPGYSGLPAHASPEGDNRRHYRHVLFIAMLARWCAYGLALAPPRWSEAG
jgi:hypothetical protein